MSTNNEALSNVPLIDETDFARSLDLILPFESIRLSGLPAGVTASRQLQGGDKFKALRDYEEGDDTNDIDQEATAEDPEHQPILRVNHANITPSLWIGTDMLKRHHTGKDGFYAKRSLALSAVFALLRTASSTHQGMPVAFAAANDHFVDASPRPRSGSHNMLNISEQLFEMANPEGDIPAQEEQPQLSDVLGHIGHLASKKVVAVVSDFRGLYFWPDHPKDNWKGELETIARKDNEIIAVEIVSPEDSAIDGLIHTVNHSPFGHVWAGRQGKKYREKYAQNSQEQQAAIDVALADVNAIHVRLRTDDLDWHANLAEQLLRPESRVYPAVDN